MSDIEARLKAMEDRIAIENVLLAYYTACDSLSDIDGLVNCFLPDGVCDLTDLGLDRLEGHDAIRGFFTGVFAEMTHHAHHVSNFRISRLEGDRATAHGYVIGRAKGRSGLRVDVSCHYDIELVRTSGGWKISLFDEGSLMPLGNEVSDLHAHG